MLSLFQWDKEDAHVVTVFAGHIAVRTASVIVLSLYSLNVINNVINWQLNRKESNN